METAAKYEVAVPVLNLEDVKKYIAPNASDKELFMFMNISKSYGLNPFKREVHFIKYGTSPGQVIVGYELYLKRAEATGQLDGWSVVVLDKSQETERAQITIHRKDRGHPFIWEVYRSEFDKQQSVWKQMPQFMLKKVAIAQGFRLCFPEILGGMPYIPEEINGHRSEELPTPSDEIPEFKPPQEPEKPKPAAKKGAPSKFDFLKIMASHKKELGEDQYYAILGNHGYEHANDITTRDHQILVYKEMIAAMESGTQQQKDSPSGGAPSRV